MAIHDFLCASCGTVEENVYVALKDFDTFFIVCPCGEPMDYDLRSKTKRNCRSIKFKEFTLHHTRRLDGTPEGREIHSLADIRRFEKEHQDTAVCVEAFSYDSQQHIPDPVADGNRDEVTKENREKFIQKYRDMDI
jgi:hypothetical protein